MAEAKFLVEMSSNFLALLPFTLCDWSVRMYRAAKQDPSARTLQDSTAEVSPRLRTHLLRESPKSRMYTTFVHRPVCATWDVGFANRESDAQGETR